MEKKFLKQYIEKCPVTDFSTNGNIEEREEILNNYLKEFIGFLREDEESIIKNLWENSFAPSQVLLLHHDGLLRRCLVYFDIAIGIFNFISSKYINSRKSTKIADMISVHMQYTFNLYKSIIILTMNGCYYSVISEYRTMYESFVITKYLQIHPELLAVYKDHSEVVTLEINKMSISFPKEQEERLKYLINKYGKDFRKDFGWTKSIIHKEEERKLITLVKECKIDSFFGPLYKVACNYSHPSSLASTTRTDLSFIKPFLQVAMYIINYQMLDFIIECKVVRREAIIMKSMLEQVYNEISNDFFDYSNLRK